MTLPMPPKATKKTVVTTSSSALHYTMTAAPQSPCFRAADLHVLRDDIVV
jgi:hypothetical protein